MAEVAWQIILCIIVADFISGLIHWFEDTYGLPEWPILGRLIIDDNIHHHKEPGDMSKTAWQRNYIPLGFTTLACLGLWLYGVQYWQVFVALSITAFANETHAWCHGLGRNKLVILLQEMGLVISPVNHGHHHRSPFNKGFCVMTNWLNPILDRIAFWPFLESFIAQTFEIYPKRLSKERDYV